MSIVRVSYRGDKIAVPKADGEYIDKPFDPSKGYGRMRSFPKPDESAAKAVLKKDRADVDPFVKRAIAGAAAKLPPGAPVCVMANGFLFDPEKALTEEPKECDNPHGRIFHFKTRDLDEEIKEHTTSWPLRLGFQRNDKGANGLAIAAGWYSHPGFATSLIEGYKNFYSRAYRYAVDSAWPLIVTLDAVVAALPGRQIDIFCHSLGSTLVVRALALAAKFQLPLLSHLGRVVIIGGSEYTGEARLMYKRVREYVHGANLADDQGPTFYNVVSRENLVLDMLAENFGPRSFFTNTQVIGHNGLETGSKEPRWIDMQIDSGKVRSWLKVNHSLEVAGDDPGSIWDHWYYYTWPGNMAFYGQVLRNRPVWSIARMRAPSPVTNVPFPEGVGVGAFAQDAQA